MEQHKEKDHAAYKRAKAAWSDDRAEFDKWGGTPEEWDSPFMRGLRSDA